MKYLMTGLAMSVALAIAMPAWAQTQMSPPAQSQAGMVNPHHPMMHHHGYRYQNSLADRLNAEELATLQGGTPVHRMPSGGKALTTPNR